jgi:hypothetical protein
VVDVTATGKGVQARSPKSVVHVLVQGGEWAHVEALDPDAGYWARRFAQLVNWRARGEKAVIEPSSLQRRNSSSSSRKSRG